MRSRRSTKTSKPFTLKKSFDYPNWKSRHGMVFTSGWFMTQALHQTLVLSYSAQSLNLTWPWSLCSDLCAPSLFTMGAEERLISQPVFSKEGKVSEMSSGTSYISLSHCLELSHIPASEPITGSGKQIKTQTQTLPFSQGMGISRAQARSFILYHCSPIWECGSRCWGVYHNLHHWHALLTTRFPWLFILIW